MGCPACNPELTQKQLEFQNSGRLARKGEPIVFTIRLTSIEQVWLPETLPLKSGLEIFAAAFVFWLLCKGPQHS